MLCGLKAWVGNSALCSSFPKATEFAVAVALLFVIRRESAFLPLPLLLPFFVIPEGNLRLLYL